MIDPMIVKGYKSQFSRRKLEWLEEEGYQLGQLIPPDYLVHQLSVARVSITKIKGGEKIKIVLCLDRIGKL